MQEMIITRMTVDELKEMLRVEMQAALVHIPPLERVPQEDLLTISGACELLNLAKSTLYNLVYKQAIPCMKRGKKLYFSKKELIKWVAQGRKETQEEIDEQAQAFLDSRPPRKRD